MNNRDFQKLLSSSDASARKDAPTARSASASLGARRKSNVPMTPRALGASRADHARQRSKNNADGQESKKFKSLAVPRGVKIKTGSTSRETRQDDEREVRIRALEEQVKLGQVGREQFERMRDDITGGDVSATHLVKGLDRKLLERVRRGEDVFAEGEEQKPEQDTSQVDADEELDRLEHEEVVPVQREQTQKKGELDPSFRPAPIIGVKRSRNDILAELKAQRQAAAEAKKTTESHSGPGFRKFGEQSAQSSKIEIDDKGREVLITVDEQGNVKRKVRKVAAPQKPKTALPMPDGNAKPLGADVVVPEYKKIEPVDDEDDDIFEGVGDSYDPLGVGEDDDDDEVDDDSDLDEESPAAAKSASAATGTMSSKAEAGSGDATTELTPGTAEPVRKNNYFQDDPIATERKDDAEVPFRDPAILAALKRAAALDRNNADGDDDDGERESQQDRQKGSKPLSAAERLLGAPRDRDYDDLDMGFGGSRGGDDDDDDVGSKIKLSEWRGGKDGDDEVDDRRAKGPRKRGSKRKKKGDKNNAADVLRVLQGRKAAAA